MNINKKETYNLDKVYKYVFDKRWRGKPSEMSVETYYKDIKEFFDNKDIKYIDYQLIEKFKVHLTNKITNRKRGGEPSGSSINFRLSVLKIILEEANNLRLINYMPKVQRVSVSDCKAKGIFTKQQENNFKANINNLFFDPDRDFYTWFVFAINTGLRHIEINCLDMNKVKQALQSESRTIDIYSGKTKHTRPVYLNRQVEYSLIQNKMELPKYDKNRLNYLWKKVRLASMLDESYTPYSTRHTCCTRLVEAGVDIKSVQYFMGHKDIKTTLTYYAKPTDKMMSKLHNELERASE